MKNIKDIVIGIFAVIGFTAILMSFTSLNQPEKVDKDPYGDEIDLYGSEGGYGDEYGFDADGLGELDMYGVDLGDEHLDAGEGGINNQRRDEHYLIDFIFKQVTQHEFLQKLQSSVKSIGKKSVERIVSS